MRFSQAAGAAAAAANAKIQANAARLPELQAQHRQFLDTDPGLISFRERSLASVSTEEAKIAMQAAVELKIITALLFETILTVEWSKYPIPELKYEPSCCLMCCSCLTFPVGCCLLGCYMSANEEAVDARSIKIDIEMGINRSTDITPQVMERDLVDDDVELAGILRGIEAGKDTLLNSPEVPTMIDRGSLSDQGSTSAAPAVSAPAAHEPDPAPTTLTVAVKIPLNKKPGSTLNIAVMGVTHTVTIPVSAKPGQTVQFEVPVVKALTVEIKIPPNKKPGSIFAVQVEGNMHNVIVPVGAKSGQTIRVQVPGTTPLGTRL